MVRNWFGAIIGLTLGTAAPSSAYAQSEWEYSLSAYGWFTGLSSQVETRFGDVDSDASFSDILEQLNMAAFATFEARRARWALVTDLNYASLTAEQDAPVSLAFEDIEADTRLTVFSTLAAYAVVDRSDLRIDLAGGFRYYDLDMDVTFNAAAAANDRSDSFGDSWIDAVVGARMRAELSDAWFVDGFADIGGFGVGDASDISWQVYAGVGYRLNEMWSLRGGYRYLSLDKDIGGRDTELELYGPVLGVTARF
jgi:opacity protein-like surface antigen